MKKMIFLIILILVLPINVKATKQDDLGRHIAGVAASAATTYVSDFTYTYFWDGTPTNPISRKSVTNGYLSNGYKGIKSSGYTYGFKNRPGINGSFTNKYATYCETWALLIPYHARGGGATTDPYVSIPLNTANLKPGDKTRYTYPDSHIAIYVDDNNDSDPDTYRIAEAAGYNGGIRVSVARFSGKGETGKVTGMLRIPEDVANQISYNVINASSNWHDSLDHFKPIVTSVNVSDNSGNVTINGTDYKQYNGTVHSRDVEPANNGIVGYAVTKSSTEPTSGWTKISAREVLNIQTKVNSNGTYYAWVLDVGGNVASKSFTVTNVDNINPSIGIPTFTQTANSITITVNGASDSSGIKEYTYYLNDALVNTSNINTYTFYNLNHNTIYSVKYAVKDNSGNISLSSAQSIKTVSTIQNITLDRTSLSLIISKTYGLRATVTPSTLDGTIKWSSSNPSVATVNNGLVTALSPGTATITVTGGEKVAKCTVTVTDAEISFITKSLAAASVNGSYNMQIRTNINSTFKVIDGSLPPGLTLNENGTITGTPSIEGTYQFSVLASYSKKVLVNNFEIKVYKEGTNISNSSGFSLWPIIIIFVIGGGIARFLYMKKQQDSF